MVAKFIVVLSLAAAASAGLVPIAKVVYEEPEQPAQYDFEYSIRDDHSGDIKDQKETRAGDVVQGSYSLVQPDGVHRIVEYTADKEHGFNANVRYEGSPIEHASAKLVAAPVAKIAYAAPVAYNTPVAKVAYASPVAYNTPVAKITYAAAPASYSSAPVAKVAYSAPVTYNTPVAKVTYAVAPVSYSAPVAKVAYATPVTHNTPVAKVTYAAAPVSYNAPESKVAYSAPLSQFTFSSPAVTYHH